MTERKQHESDSPSKVNILLISKDFRTVSLLSRELPECGINVTTASSKNEIRVQLEEMRHQATIIDADIFAQVKSIEGIDKKPYLILSSDNRPKAIAKATTSTYRGGLGAENYLLKEENPEVNAAYIRSVLRRSKIHSPSEPVMKFSHLEIDPEAGLVKNNGKRIELSEDEGRLLYYIARRAGSVFDSKQLYCALFDAKPYDYNAERLYRVIRSLRRKIERDRREPKLITTITVIGYAFGIEP